MTRFFQSSFIVEALRQRTLPHSSSFQKLIPVTDSELSRFYNQRSRRQTMITNSQPNRTSHTHSPAPRTNQQQASKPRLTTRLVVRKRLRHRVRSQEMNPCLPGTTPASGTQSRFLLTKTSVAFDQSRPPETTPAQQPVAPVKSFKQAANGYAQCLYNQLLHNRNDSSNYSLGEARRLAQATKALSQNHLV